MKFKQKLGLVCIIFVLVPVLFISIGSVWTLKGTLKGMQYDMMCESVYRQRVTIENHLNQLHAQATWMSYSTLIDQPAALKAYTNQMNDMKVCGVLDGFGSILVASDERLVGQNLLSEDTLSKVIKLQKGIISMGDAALIKNGIAVVTTLPPQNSTKGNYWFSVYDEQMLIKLMGSDMDQTIGRTFLIDSQGNLIGYPDEAVRTVEDLQEGQVPLEESLLYGGFILGADVVPQGHERTIQPLIQQMLIILTLTLILLYMLLRQTLNCIFKPVMQLQETISRLEKGDMNARFAYYSKDELGIIALAFNELIDKQMQMMGRIKESENRYRVILEQADEVIWEWRSGSRELYISENWQRKCCKVLNPRHVTLDNLFDVIYPDDREKCLKQLGTLTETQPTCQFEMRIHDVHERYVWMLIRATALAFQNHMPIQIVGVAIDIDEARKKEKELLKLATYDHLTKVYNKSTFEQKASNALKLAQFRNEPLVMLFIDVDDFKKINDQYGHDVGDIVLESLARLLNQYVGEFGMIGRFGGDEFVICITNMTVLNNLDVWLEKLENLLGNYVFFEQVNEKMSVRCSLGKARYPEDGLQYEELVRYADQLMYQNKAQRKGERI
ncbi:MAG: diguanylate cyclase [Cellulosilyticaceae bacterium]